MQTLRCDQSLESSNPQLQNELLIKYSLFENHRATKLNVNSAPKILPSILKGFFLGCLKNIKSNKKFYQNQDKKLYNNVNLLQPAVPLLRNCQKM